MLRGDLDADVAIVGGGLTGCVTALACANAGLSVVLLEAAHAGEGTTGRGAGLVLTEPDIGFRDVAALHGLRAARQVFELWRAGARDAAATLRRLRVRCAAAPVARLTVADAAGGPWLRKEYEARAAAGVEGTYLTAGRARAALAMEGAQAALRGRGGLALDPWRACVGVAAAAARRGVRIAERSPVVKVRSGRDGVEVVTAGGMVRARTVVVATGTPGAEFQPLRRHFVRREAYLTLTGPVPATMRRALPARDVVLRDARQPARRVRWVDDRLLIVAGDQDETPARSRPAVLVQRTGDAMYGLLTMYPVISGLPPEYGWEASFGATADGLMYIGAHRNFPRHLFALGGTPDSLTGAFVAARIVVRAVQGAAARGDDVFGWNR